MERRIERRIERREAEGLSRTAHFIQQWFGKRTKVRVRTLLGAEDIIGPTRFRIGMGLLNEGQRWELTVRVCHMLPLAAEKIPAAMLRVDGQPSPEHGPPLQTRVSERWVVAYNTIREAFDRESARARRLGLHGFNPEVHGRWSHQLKTIDMRFRTGELDWTESDWVISQGVEKLKGGPVSFQDAEIAWRQARAAETLLKLWQFHALGQGDHTDIIGEVIQHQMLVDLDPLTSYPQSLGWEHREWIMTQLTDILDP